MAERPVVLPPSTEPGSMDMQGLALLAIYVVVALAGQVLGYGISSLIDRAAPAVGLPVFLAIFFGMLVFAWPIAVRLTNWLFPETLETPVVPADATVLRAHRR